MNSNRDTGVEELIFAAETGDIPPTYVKVWRWVCAGESEMWELSPRCVPSNLRDDQTLAVTIPEAMKPPETGIIRIEFWVDTSKLERTEKAEWLQIRAPISGIPVAGLRMYWNEGLLLLSQVRVDQSH
jgi:hypothetical protein